MAVRIINKTKSKDYEQYYPLLDDILLKTKKLLNIKEELIISCTLVGPITIKRLNRNYRHIDKVTDVLSFAIEDNEAYIYDNERDLGDIFINLKRLEKQAEEYGHSKKREFLFLFCHGLLHCLGYDHQNAEDEKIMFALQDKIIGKRNEK